MPDPLPFIRRSVRSIKPYYMSEQSVKVKLNQNESPFDLPPSIKSLILKQFSEVSWNRYPSFTTDALREKIAEIEGVSPEMVLIGNGSNELLQMLCSIILEPRTDFLMVQPTFQLYEQIGRVFGANLIQVELASDLNYPINQLLDINQSKPIPLQIYCSPNNPTGSILTLNQIEQILKIAAGIVAIDEAYCDFSQLKATHFLKFYPNLVITRTFSKAFCMASFRLGYLIAAPALATEIYKAKLPYNIDKFSELTALVVLNHIELIHEQVATILQQRDWLIAALKEFPEITVYPTFANFFLISTPLKPDDLFNRLLKTGILVRNVSHNHPLLADKLRIAVGIPSENQYLIEALRKIFR